jgi:hypothetical protein
LAAFAIAHTSARQKTIAKLTELLKEKLGLSIQE